MAPRFILIPESSWIALTELRSRSSWNKTNRLASETCSIPNVSSGSTPFYGRQIWNITISN